MMKADLHIHSTISDGSNTIHEIIEKAKKKGLSMIAVTDHDTVSHYNRIPQSKDIKVIAGTEISAVDPKTKGKAHILGYGISEIRYIEKLTLPLLQKRHENSLKQIDVLKKYGFIINETQVHRADGTYIYKQHIMEYLVRTKQANEMFGDFYKTIFKNGGICDFDIDYINVFDAVRAIKQSGGKAVLAHSGQQKNFYLIPELVKCGLDGLEYNHLSNSIEDKKVIKEYAAQYQLFLTGGSDYHGRYEATKVDIGDYISEQSGVGALSCQ